MLNDQKSKNQKPETKNQETKNQQKKQKKNRRKSIKVRQEIGNAWQGYRHRTCPV